MLQLYRSQSSLPAAAAAAAAAVRHEEFLRELVPTTMDPFPLVRIKNAGSGTAQ